MSTLIFAAIGILAVIVLGSLAVRAINRPIEREEQRAGKYTPAVDFDQHEFERLQAIEKKALQAERTRARINNIR